MVSNQSCTLLLGCWINKLLAYFHNNIGSALIRRITMSDDNTVNKTTKMARNDINQDHLDKKDQQRTNDCALDMMQGMHDHEEHDSNDQDSK